MVHTGYFDSCKALKTRTCVTREKKTKTVDYEHGYKICERKGKNQLMRGTWLVIAKI